MMTLDDLIRGKDDFLDMIVELGYSTNSLWKNRYSHYWKERIQLRNEL